MAEFEFQSIGIIESCFKQKFSIPRQPGLVPEATATIILEPEFGAEEIVRGLGNFSHIWVIFVFHKSQISKNKNTVRPPRLGGEKRMGVFATRSNYRPNPIGQSVVKLESVEHKNNLTLIKVSGGDFLDGTPVLDIKPYVPYVDSIPSATSTFAAQAPEKQFSVKISSDALEQIEEASKKTGVDILQFVESLLSYDPRPTHVQPNQVLATRIFDYDLKWKIDNDIATVVSLDFLN